MVQNPCDSQLVPGFYGSSEGILARFKTSWDNQSSGSCGYFIVIPELFGDDCVIYYSNADPSHQPLNNATPPIWGTASGWDQTTTTMSKDNAAYFVGTDTCSAARTISSCLQMTYTGPMQSSAGEVAYLSEVQISNILHGGPGTSTPSINLLFIGASKIMRLGVDTVEIVGRPDVDTPDFLTQESDAFATDGGVVELSTLGKMRTPRAYGFAWRSVASPAALAFMYTRNLEWQPESILGLAMPTVKSVGPSKASAVLTYLDTHHPGWGSKVVNGIGAVAGGLARLAFTGAGLAAQNAPALLKYGSRLAIL